MRHMSARLFRIIMPVSDIARAEQFYAAVLDTPALPVSPGRRYFDCQGVILACFDPGADGDGYAARPNAEPVYFAVADLAATRRACLAAGARLSAEDIHGDPAGEIVTRPWGERSFYAFDPFDNPLCFVDQSTIYTGPR